MASNNGTAEQLMQALASGRGNNYGYKMSQRQPGGTVRGIYNAPDIHSGRGTPMDPANYMPDYAGRAWGRGESMGWPGSDRTSSFDRGDTNTRFFSGLTAEEDLLLRERGYIDKQGSRFIIDRSTGNVTQNRIPSGPTGGQNFGGRGQTLQEAVGGPGAMKPEWGGMLPELEKQMFEEKYRRRGR
jgi:hypothetical protein